MILNDFKIKVFCGLLMLIALSSCDSRILNNADITMILKQSTDKITGSDLLRFFPPMILSDEISDARIIKIEQQKYNQERTIFLHKKKFLVLPDSMIIRDSKANLEVISTLIPVAKRYYSMISKSKMNDLE